MKLENKLFTMKLNSREKEIATIVLNHIRQSPKTLPELVKLIENRMSERYVQHDTLRTITRLRENDVIYLNLNDKKYYLPAKVKFPYSISNN